MSEAIMERWFKTAWNSTLALLCPAECVWCEQPIAQAELFCDDCKGVIKSDYYRCRRCALPLPPVVPNGYCSGCTKAKWRISTIQTLGPYRGRLREAVILMKKRRSEALRHGVGALIAEMLLEWFDEQSSTSPGTISVADGHGSEGNGSDGKGSGKPTSNLPMLLPVANHWTRNLTRSVCPASSLASIISMRTGWPLAMRTLRRVRATRKQGMLSWTDRKANVRGAFSLRKGTDLKGRTVVLVDDVLTSGATANEIARLLVTAGATKIVVAVAARGTGSREIVIQSPSNKVQTLQN